ncbi:MAG: D-lyxose/D-mannose family sugar isomerase [Lachnospiraceae bacterium]|nr:D-lyxose/D-mannose family sugar isomerase [Lachnospiraceae bacterium]
MKRSKINQEIKNMEKLLKNFKVSLPPFCSFTPEEWAKKGHDYDEIRDNMLGWDLTDYALGDFDKIGMLLITLRNGNIKIDKYKKPYAEKLLLMKDGQTAEMHYHLYKMEDIINRGGGNVLIKVYNSNPDGSFANDDVAILRDGHKYTVSAGTRIKLMPGESITITPGLYHDFAVEEGSGDVLLGEVSMCNDDNTDNYFYNKKVGRFPAIEEDEKPYRLLCNEYPKVN